MAESVTIARPYAQAVFRLAKESGALATWSERLQRLVAIAQDPEMAKVVGNPQFSAAQVAALVLSVCDAHADAELSAFVGLLAENERIEVLPQIRELFEQYKSEEEGVKDALISSAYPLDAAQLNNLVSQLETHFGCKLQPRVEVDAALIGGVRVAVGVEVLDASVRGKLDAMATALKN